MEARIKTNKILKAKPLSKTQHFAKRLKIMKRKQGQERKMEL